MSVSTSQQTLAQAALLQAHARHDSSDVQLLRGRHVGLICLDEDSAAARLLQRAARALGARVTVIHAALDDASSEGEIEATARLLGRLYDAVECQQLAPMLVQRLAQSAAIPVFDGLAAAGHPGATLAARLPGDASLDDKRCWVVQALLLRSMQ